MFIAALLIGMAPDLLSFGVFHVMHPGWLSRRWAGEISGPPDLALLPGYVFHAYNVTHSLLVWAIVASLVWLITKRPQWLLCPWLLHILCDIPTHATAYFPTPFLWPLPTPFVDGVPWSTPWVMVTNYAAMFIVYCGLFFYFPRKSAETALR